MFSEAVHHFLGNAFAISKSYIAVSYLFGLSNDNALAKSEVSAKGEFSHVLSQITDLSQFFGIIPSRDFSRPKRRNHP